MERELWELDRLVRYATELQNLISDAEAMAPARSEGTDRSGAVRMAIGRDLLPETITVVGDWAKRLNPRLVGAAVAEAYQACTARLTAQWAQTLQERGFQERMQRLERLEAEPSGPPPGSAGALPPAFQRPAGRSGSNRSLNAIAEDMIKAADTASAFAATAASRRPAHGMGRTRTRTAAIVLSKGGLVSCEVDPAWAARQTGPLLTQALRGALAQAREQLAAAERDATPGGVPQLNGLLEEILGKLRDPRLETEE